MQDSNKNRSDIAAAILIEKIVRDTYAAKSSSEIQPLQWSILRYIEGTPEQRCTMSWITKFLGLTHSPVIRSINTLVKRELVEQRNNPNDARSNLLSLTKKGVDSLASDPILEVVKRIRNLSEREREQFKMLVQSLALGSNNGKLGIDENHSAD